MFGFILFLHVVVCIILSLIILMQSGRGGGLSESFASAESMFGARTNAVLVKGTTILGSIFLITCLGLAFLSAQGSKSLIKEDVDKGHSAASGGVAAATKPPAPSTEEASTASGANQAASSGAQENISTAPAAQTQSPASSTITNSTTTGDSR